MSEPIYNVLFLCADNSATSILAECMLNRVGDGRFAAYSAGSTPKGVVHPFALDLLIRDDYPTDALRSKSWDEFAGPGARPLHYIFTLWEDAPAATCPQWPGQPLTAGWPLADPSRVEGSEPEQRRAFMETLRTLHDWVTVFVGLPLTSLDERTLQTCLGDIGRRT
jgi:protein-tyrosine-phosphatase